MHTYYGDILKLTQKKPLWWDENAVPRFCRFSPQQIANIYAGYCCLMLIACQNCNHPFKVAMSWNTEPTFKKDFDIRLIHYGDPPNASCCAAGPTMNCMDLQVLQWWTREGVQYRAGQWVRERDNEVELPDFQETVKVFRRARDKTLRLRRGYKNQL